MTSARIRRKRDRDYDYTIRKKLTAELIEGMEELRAWDDICKLCAAQVGISPEKAKAILENLGYHAHDHTGINDAMKIVRAAVPLNWPKL